MPRLGTVTVMELALLTATFVPAVPLKLTVAPVMKLVPVMVIEVPAGPEVGDRLEIVGAWTAAVVVKEASAPFTTFVLSVAVIRKWYVVPAVRPVMFAVFAPVEFVDPTDALCP